MDPRTSQLYGGGVDRLRSGLACLTCRKRKNKCDGSRPACGFCNKRSLTCIYDDSAKYSAANRGYVETLERKIRKLEQELGQRRDAPSYVAPTARQSTDEALVQDFQWQNPRVRTRAIPLHDMHPVLPDPDCTSLEKDHDLVKVIKYGEISIHSALADFGVAPSGTSPSDARATHGDAESENSSIQDADAMIREEQYPLDDSFVLPPRALANRLVDLFFDHVYPIVPLVHEPSFRKEVDALYTDRRSGSIAFRSMVNAVFAYGCDYLDLGLARTYELSQDFHERATDLILLVCYELASLEVVQALLLVTLHLNSSMQFHRMWVNTGLLVRTAQALNLHVDPSAWNIRVIEKELRKRLWWSIYSLDRFISLKHGRPPALDVKAGHSVPPTAVDDDQIFPTYIASSSGRPPSQLLFFIHLMDLIHISEISLSSGGSSAPWKLSQEVNHDANRNHDTRGAIYTQTSVALEQESKLSTWLDNLPEHLRFNYANTDPKLRMQQRSLQIRYLHTRLMIHRPNMIFALKFDSRKENLCRNDTFFQSILSASIEQCIQCCTELLSLVKEYYEQKSLGPWWLLLQFIFTTLATLCAVRARRNSVPNLDDGNIDTTIDKAMGLLRSFGDIHPTLGPVPHPETMARLRSPTNNRVLHPSLPTATCTIQPTPSRTSPRLQNPAEYQPHDLFLHNPDQSLEDCTAELFSDVTFGGFNFGALDPILQA
ncbi:uncharacterized protein PV07_01241 [Cladophialophora immunda]|uniref:Zn(2)-C6 fungal-type domain-containing protein n=1 Tax=Cladophialophora immunda TaxID=569365 RepID=A0A0D2CTI8_9EURO|nr:uncharacterized protein PV07_01241 [Cladophialophora immunda]KIW34463.1 hypothetical protein PV07_01241 [Cladophialophora immunda]